MAWRHLACTAPMNRLLFCRWIRDSSAADDGPERWLVVRHDPEVLFRSRRLSDTTLFPLLIAPPPPPPPIPWILYCDLTARGTVLVVATCFARVAHLFCFPLVLTYLQYLFTDDTLCHSFPNMYSTSGNGNVLQSWTHWLFLLLIYLSFIIGSVWY